MLRVGVTHASGPTLTVFFHFHDARRVRFSITAFISIKVIDIIFCHEHNSRDC